MLHDRVRPGLVDRIRQLVGGESLKIIQRTLSHAETRGWARVTRDDLEEILQIPPFYNIVDSPRRAKEWDWPSPNSPIRFPTAIRSSRRPRPDLVTAYWWPQNPTERPNPLETNSQTTITQVRELIGRVENPGRLLVMKAGERHSQTHTPRCDAYPGGTHLVLRVEETVTSRDPTRGQKPFLGLKMGKLITPFGREDRIEIR